MNRGITAPQPVWGLEDTNTFTSTLIVIFTFYFSNFPIFLHKHE